MKLIVFLFLLLSSVVYSNELLKYEFTYQDEDLIIAFTLKEEPDMEIFNLKNPFRLIMTLKNTSLNSSVSKKNIINNEIIKDILAVEYSRNGKKNSKLILSLKREVAYTVDKFNNRILIILKGVKDVSAPDSFVENKTENQKNNEVIESKPQKIRLENLLTAVNYQYVDEDLIISLKTNKEVKYRSFELVNPFRLFIDLEDVKLADNVESQKDYNDEYLKKHIINKISRNGKNKIRVTFFFKDKKVYSVEQFRNNIVITLKNAKMIKPLTSLRKTEKTAPVKNVKIKDENVRNGNLLSQIDYQYVDEDMIISLKTDKEVKYRSFDLVNPFRLFIDLEDVKLADNIKPQKEYNDEYLKKHIINKMFRNGKNKIRVTFFFKDRKVYSVEQFKNNIVITLKGVKSLKRDFTVENNESEIEKKESAKNIENENPVEYSYNDNSLLIAIKLKNDEKIKVYHLTDPFRIIIDIQNIEFYKEKKKEIVYDDDFLKKMIFIKYKRGNNFNTRITIGLKEYVPYEVDKINNTVLLTLSNIIIPQKNTKVAVNKTEVETEVENEEEDNSEFIQEEIENNNDTMVKENSEKEIKENILRKIIFKKYKKTGRVLLKTVNKPVYETQLSGKTFIIILKNTKFGSRMASLTLNTEFFKTKVKKISPSYENGNIVIRVNLGKAVKPKIKWNNDKLILDF